MAQQFSHVLHYERMKMDTTSKYTSTRSRATQPSIDQIESQDNKAQVERNIGNVLDLVAFSNLYRDNNGALSRSISETEKNELVAKAMEEIKEQKPSGKRKLDFPLGETGQKIILEEPKWCTVTIQYCKDDQTSPIYVGQLHDTSLCSFYI